MTTLSADHGAAVRPAACFAKGNSALSRRGPRSAISARSGPGISFRTQVDLVLVKTHPADFWVFVRFLYARKSDGNVNVVLSNTRSGKGEFHIKVGFVIVAVSERVRQEILVCFFETVLCFAFSVTLHFVIGERACTVPPEDRDDPYGCDMWNVSIPSENTTLVL